MDISSKGNRMLNIIGGSYYEICNDPEWNELYGSGFRAVVALAEKNIDLTFHTYTDGNTNDILSTLCRHLSVNLLTQKAYKNIRFNYEHPLANPCFYLHHDTFQNNKPLLVKNIANAISFGMLEGNAIISSERAVFDPQTPEQPESFWKNGSTAKELIIILNYNEAKKLAKAEDLPTLGDYLLNNENAKAAIIKNGAIGAYLFQKDKETIRIPSFITNKVWPIGTGDIFTSYFGYEWMIKNSSLDLAAYNASLATANYAENKILPIPKDLIHFTEFKKTTEFKKKVYLAGPFFNISQRWLINQFRNALFNDLDVFSPFHDVGLGSAEEVVPLDIKAIQDCDILLAIVDGLDSGTLFEIGYAKAFKKPVVVFVESEEVNGLTMLIGTECIIENDFSSAVYKTLWEAYK